jgi:MFS family permease
MTTKSTASAIVAGPLAGAWTARSLFGLAALLAVLLLSTNLQIQTLLVEPIRAELRLSDLQLGQLQGLTVVTLGALAAWPIGWLADRWDRRWVLALCVLVWSAATYGGGLSQGFDGLLWAMVGLAIGEAALLPIVYALTPQVVPARQLSVANAAVYATLVLGSGLALVAGGAVYDALQVHASRLPWPEGTPAWRLMFFVTALLGLPVVLLMLGVRLQPVGPASNAAQGASLGTVAPPSPSHHQFGRYLREHGLSLVMVQASLSLITLGWFQLMLWTPAILGRSFGSTVGGAGLDFGLVVTLASAVGTAAGLVWVTRPANRDNPVGNFRLVWLGGLAALPLVVAMAWAPSAGVLLLLGGLAMTCLVIGVSQAPALLQQMSPPALLSRSIALFPLVALPLRGLQAPAVGWLSDRFGTADPRGLLHAMVIVAAVTLALGVLALWRLQGRYARLAAHARGATAHFKN